MNPEFPITDETLSAFLDGELPEAERKQIEAWLESSPDARRELAELRQIGTLVRSIPRPTVPEGFQAELMQRVEQEAGDMLVQRPPRAGEVSPNGRVAASGSSWGGGPHGIRSWLAGLVSLAAVAGIILAVGMFLQNQGNQGNVALEQAAPRNEIPDHEQVFDIAGVADESGEESEESIVMSPLPSRDVEPGAFPPSVAESFPGPMERPLDAPGSAADIPPAEGGLNGPSEQTALERMLANRADPSIPLTPGEMTEFFGEIAGEAVVVELICVDVNEVANTSNQLEVLLATNGIRPASEYGVPIDPESLDFAEGDQILIYVEADEQTVAATLEQMNELRGVVSAEVNNLVEYPVADGNVTEPLRQGLDQVRAIYEVAQTDAAPAEENPSEAVRLTQPDEVDAESDAASGDIAAATSQQPTDPDAQLPTANGAYVFQNANEELIADIEMSQNTRNSIQESQSRSQDYAQRITENFDRDGEGAATDAAIESEADAAAQSEVDAMISQLPVQLIIVLRTAMPPIAGEAGNQ